jgi:hypothetical protein
MNDAPAPNFGLTESRPWYKKTTTKWLVLVVLALLILGMWRCGTRAFAGAKVAKQSVDRFHGQFNRSEYHEIYVEATEEFRGAGREPDTNAFLGKVHEKLGDFVRSDEPTYFANVSNNGTFVTLTYRADFTRGNAQEKFVWRIDGDQARLLDYRIDSRDLIMK